VEDEDAGAFWETEAVGVGGIRRVLGMSRGVGGGWRGLRGEQEWEKEQES
jgi:hypothetical protein